MLYVMCGQIVYVGYVIVVCAGCVCSVYFVCTGCMLNVQYLCTEFIHSFSAFVIVVWP